MGFKLPPKKPPVHDSTTPVKQATLLSFQCKDCGSPRLALRSKTLTDVYEVWSDAKLDKARNHVDNVVLGDCLDADTDTMVFECAACHSLVENHGELIDTYEELAAYLAELPCNANAKQYTEAERDVYKSQEARSAIRFMARQFGITDWNENTNT